MDELHTDQGAASLVGRLIRSYREGMGDNGRPLSQERFLNLTRERAEESAAAWDRSSLSRWETGTRLAPREFLEALGRVCDIPQHDMDQLMSLAGYAGSRDYVEQGLMLTAARDIESRVERIQEDVSDVKQLIVGHPTPLDASAVVKSTLRRALPPGVFALTVGFFLHAMGQNGNLVLVVYVLGLLSLVLGQGVLRWVKRDRSMPERDHVEDLFYISLFFTMNASLLITALTRTDHFGFHTIGAFTNTPVSFLLTMLAHLALSLAGSLVFSVSWSRQYGPKGGRSTLSRALWTTLPPLVFVYVILLATTNLGNYIHFMYILGILFLAFTTIVALNEPGMTLSNSESVLKVAVVVIVLLGAFGILGTLSSYQKPEVVMIAENVRIIPLQEVTSEELGYSDVESTAYWRLGIVWMSSATFVYLIVVVGGYTITTISKVPSANRRTDGFRETQKQE